MKSTSWSRRIVGELFLILFAIYRFASVHTGPRREQSSEINILTLVQEAAKTAADGRGGTQHAKLQSTQTASFN